MSNERNINDSRNVLERLARNDPQQKKEISFVTSPGARAAGWAVKIKSLAAYNTYNVRTVILGEPGSLPVEIGDQMQAVNLAESFLYDGQLLPGTYAAMLKFGEKNIFYAPV